MLRFCLQCYYEPSTLLLPTGGLSQQLQTPPRQILLTHRPAPRLQSWPGISFSGLGLKQTWGVDSTQPGWWMPPLESPSWGNQGGGKKVGGLP